MADKPGDTKRVGRGAIRNDTTAMAASRAAPWITQLAISSLRLLRTFSHLVRCYKLADARRTNEGLWEPFPCSGNDTPMTIKPTTQLIRGIWILRQVY